MKKLPTGRQNFEAIIKEDLLYVDKTRQVYNIVNTGNLYFLSRPRRFGKSLLVSIFRYLFLGKKELFKDLYLGKETDYNFEAYPVLQFNFSNYGHQVENLEAHLSGEIQQYAKDFEIELNMLSLSLQFQSLIEGISSKGKPVVLLIDEYDKPITDFLTEYQKAKVNQKILRDFFSPLKDLDAQGHLRFMFITGVSKFSKVSLFSDLNNLTDLSISTLSNDLLGFTHNELETHFKENIDQVSEKFKLSSKEIIQAIKNWYNGYSYDGITKLYNPYSVLNFFLHQNFKNYWFSTGTPTFLVESIRNRGINPQSLEEIVVDDAFFEKFSLKDLAMPGLLFQTGYLTIKEVETEIYETHYYLGYPNLEVRKSMMRNMAEAFTYQNSSRVAESLIKMQQGLKKGNLPLFFDQLTIILSNLKYNWQPPKQYKTQTELLQMWEGYFHAVMYNLMAYMQMSVQAEVSHHKGRLDLIAETDGFLYLMEFKLDEPIEDAIAQIRNRQYILPYQNSPKTIFLVGVNFSKEERNVENWEAEEWKRD